MIYISYIFFNNWFLINSNNFCIDIRNCNNAKLGIYNINFSVIVNRTARFIVPLFDLIHVHSVGVRDIIHICDIFYGAVSIAHCM
jgi:hypothetical protein